MHKRIIITVLLLLQAGGILPVNAALEDKQSVGLNASAFGAKGDGIHDDTRAIQTALDSLDHSGGGTIYLDSGDYLVTSLRLGKKTSLVGNGIGATLIKQIKGTKADCIIVPAKSAALKISDLSIIGNDANGGLVVENSKGGHENHPYLYNKDIKDNVPQPYKWMAIDNICIYHFENGLQIEKPGFNINICNSTFSHNGVGVIMRCTDSSIHNCYITNNKKDGLYLYGSNNRISNIKSIFNGKEAQKESAAIAVLGNRCLITNCETQDNFCQGFLIKGIYNLVSNCLSNTDGYGKNYRYDPSIEACGFRIKGLYNSFSNCGVTSYIEKYGALYYTPVKVDSAISYYYPDILNDIKVLIANDRVLFNEPLNNVQTLNCKGPIKNAKVVTSGKGKYFSSVNVASGAFERSSCHLNNLSILADINGEEGRILNIGDKSQLSLSLTGKKVSLYLQGEKKMELPLDTDAVMGKDDMRLIISFYQYGNEHAVRMLCYEKTTNRGWIKKEIRRKVELNSSTIKNAKVILGGDKLLVKRLALSYNPISESVTLPQSNTNHIYDSAIMYVDADSY